MVANVFQVIAHSSKRIEGWIISFIAHQKRFLLICGFIDNNGRIDTFIVVTRYICTAVYMGKKSRRFTPSKDDPLEVFSLWPSANSYNMCLVYVVHTCFLHTITIIA
jgi:hypothetical protein